MRLRLQQYLRAKFLGSGGLVALALFVAGCSGPTPLPAPYRDPRMSLDRRVTDLMGRLRPDEKLALVRGAQTLSIQPNSRLGIPALRVVRGAMGISEKDGSGHPIFATALPANIGMAATWNPGLMEQAGIVVAQQALALGRGEILGPLLDISHSPLDGRVFETYGEDPWLVSQIAVGYISGMQGEGAIATAIFNGGPVDSRVDSRVDSKVDSSRSAREFDLRPVEAAISQAGVWSLMPRDGNPIRGYLNTLGFRGFQVLAEHGETNAPEGQALDDEVRGILRAMFSSGVFDRETKPVVGIETAAHRLVARTAASQSIVLLKNQGGLLPFDKNKIHSIAVIGPNADANTVSGGEYAVAARYSATPLGALRDIYGAGVFAAHSAAETARADAAIVFASAGNGEDDLIAAVAKSNPHTIVVINSGSAIAGVAMDKWLGSAPAVLEAWFPGEEGGTAIADVLSGATNPSGRLPITFPGRSPATPLFPFGYGLSYTQFEYSGLTILPPKVVRDQFVEVSVNIRNTGSRAGKETVQLYLHATHSADSIDRPDQQLRGAQQITLNPGESKRVTFTLTGSAMAYFDEKQQDWVEDQASFEVRVGASSRDIRATGALSVGE